jgi:paraquat-inducible protein B
VLNPSGTVKATVGPTLTAQEKNQQEAKEKTVLQERNRLEEEKKRDRALLIRYPNESLHQKERAEALAQIALVKQTATVRAAELHAEHAKLQEEMAFYAKDPKRAPTKLRLQLAAAKAALDGQDHFIADKDIETARTNARFDEELQRLRPLWRMNAAPAAQ